MSSNPAYPYPPQGFPPPPAGYPPAPPTPAEPRRYSAWAAMVLFFSPDLLRDVARRWKGIGLRYLLLLCLTWLPVFVKGMIGFSRYVGSDAHRLTDQIPQITLNNGTVSIDRPEPYTITDPDTGAPLIVIDTTGQTTAPPPNYPSMLLTKHTLVQRQNATQIQTHDLSNFPSFQMDSTKALQWMEQARVWVMILGLPLLVFFSLIGRLVQMLVYGAIGLIFDSAFGARLGYAALMRLSAIAITPILFIDTVLSLANLEYYAGCWWSWVGLGVGLALLGAAVKANALGGTVGMGGFSAGYPPVPGYPQGYPGYAAQPPSPPPVPPQWPPG